MGTGRFSWGYLVPVILTLNGILIPTATRCPQNVSPAALRIEATVLRRELG